MGIVEVEIDAEMITEAGRLAAKMPVLDHSIRQGEGTVYGFLGELIFRQMCGGRQANTYDYDIVMKSGLTVDVKTKMVRSIPRPDFDCSVPAGQIDQECDVYAFVRVLEDMSRGWYCGAIAKAAFFTKARFIKAGDEDGSNGWIAKADCYNLPIRDLGIGK